ncbi:S8 family serine peptidase [Clostridium sp. KNHs214]|uniref:S8 family serine peptidase n=1 Tax=Clostridium sp. KNHs214 TaxID=1540257 RepID=UPI000690FF64|nr:S8 family serine peptidase [Clostridium sp. KNHs214]
MKRRNQKLLSLFVTTMMIMSFVSGFGSKEVKAQENTNTAQMSADNTLRIKYSEKDIETFLKAKYGKGFVLNENKPLSIKPEETVRVIVQLKDKPLLEKGSKGLNFIQNAQKSVKSKVADLEGAKIRNSYTKVLNGFSMMVKKSEIYKIKALPEVKSVTLVNKYYPDMTSAKVLTQAYEAQSSSYGYKGQGMVVSIIDTGIDYRHKDMKLSDASQAKIKSKNSQGPGKYFTDKVPYGYNYAEQNYNVIDTGNMHGMHVAGIVGANGNQTEVDKNEAIQGVAPECQLLAMKVFANDPEIGGAYSDDIVAAIEDSVKHGADVINMSLGSNSGFQESDEPEQKAIKNATESGVAVVVSAGNYQYNTAPYKFGDLYDTGITGSPGIAKEAIQVASYENSNIMLFSMEYTCTSGNGSCTYEVNNVNPSEVFKSELELVDCGSGQESDFQGKDLNGKIALVQRGSNTFGEKEINAQKAGAKAIIIYNNREGYIGGMFVDPTVNIPVIGMTTADGLVLKEKVSSGLKVKFPGTLTSLENTDKNDMSDFTSWGPAPNLEFKPEISAPGGNIWSTVNKDKYENMSGTSMSAPHTSGAEALILQGVKKNYPSLTGKESVDFAKATSINTAKTLMDKSHTAVPYSPRRQGAGLVQIVDAVNNGVTVKDDRGNAAVALKEIGKTKTFALNLKNYKDKPITFNLSDMGGVLTEQKVPFTSNMSYDVKIKDAKVTFDNSTITVPANGALKVNVTINLPDNLPEESFVEGFIKLKSNEPKDNPDLVVPYIGFYGDWSKQDIIDKPIWDKDNYLGGTRMLTLGEDGNTLYYLGVTGKDEEGNPIIEEDKIAISPNGDNQNDNIYPFLTFLRNAKSMEIKLLDKDKKLVRQLATSNHIRKNVISDPNDSGYREDMDWMWDGKIYDPSTGKMGVVKDGQYYIDYVTKVDIDNAKEKHFQIPLKIDTVAPTIEVISATKSNDSSYKLQWKVSDELSGDGKFGLVYLNGKQQDVSKITIDQNGVYSCDLILQENANNFISIGAIDYASNVGVKDVTVVQGNPSFDLKFDNLSSRMSVDYKDLTITGSVGYVPKVFKINDKDVKINKDLTFSMDVTFEEGRNLVKIYAEDFDGTVLKDFAYKVDCDITAPIIELEAPKIAEDGKVYVNNDTVNVKGKVSDNTFGYKLYVNGEQKLNIFVDGEMGNDVTERTFDYEVPVTNNSFLEIKAVDVFGHETVKNVNVVVDKEKPVITVAGVEDGKVYNNNITPKITSNKTAAITSTLDKKPYNGEEITAEGAHELVVKAVDLAGNTSEYKVNFTIDKTKPVITVTGVENGKAYSSNVIAKVSCNENAKVTTALDGKAYNGEEITAEGIHELVVTAVDLAGNTSEYKVKFTIDKTKPVITVTDVEEGKLYNKDVMPKITSSEKATITSTLDGKAYKGEKITTEGIHQLVVKAVDLAGNTSEYKVNFIIDKTFPVITVTGVEDGKVYNNKVTPVIKCDDNTAKVTVTLNGKNYDGKEIASVGDYTLIVTAKDLAGNTSSKTIKFSLKGTAASGSNSASNNNNVNGQGSQTSNNKLVQTGGRMNAPLLIAIGGVLIACGCVFIRRRKRA